MAAKVPDVVHDSHQHDPNIDNAKRIPNRLILCFDGTGNSFQGNPADTNIVKLMDMFDRSATRQMHYYQPGIGTYTSSESVNQGFIGRIKKFVTQTIDCGLATSFDSHVIAGYRFLMRYYGMGDRIYIFGFSRGAFTARFLARMISAVGLLSMGNEEMVPFAYKVYQDYEMNLPNAQAAEAYSKTFRRAFCRHEGDEGIKVHFLGLFDTVNSVGTFDVGLTGNMKAPDVIGTAEHVRHAVAIDERRVKFKAALLAQDERSNESDPEDSKEVWFPGNHGDIGGGWPAEDEEPKKPLTIWQRIKRAVSKTKDLGGAHLHKEHDHFQLSDFALKWMIDELDDLNTKLKTDTLRWNEQKADFVRRFVERRPKAIRARMHDTMTFGRGSSFGKALLWKLMEYLPIIKRWEYSYQKLRWEPTRFPLNKGGTRDIPPDSLFHHSVIERMQAFPGAYRPANDVSDGIPGSSRKEYHLRDADSKLDQPEHTPYFEALKDQKRADGTEMDPTDKIYRLRFD